MTDDIRTGKHKLAALQRNARAPIKQSRNAGKRSSSLAGTRNVPCRRSLSIADKILFARACGNARSSSKSCPIIKHSRALDRTRYPLAPSNLKPARSRVNIEHAPSVRRLDIPLARLRQRVKTGQQGIIDLLTRISQIPERLIAVQPHARAYLRAEATVRNRHLTSATFNAQAAARAIAGLFIVYTCSPSTPCSCRSVSCLQAYSTPACRKLSASFS